MKTDRFKELRILTDESGVALITGLLLTAVLAILAVTAYLTTSTDLFITRNYQKAKTAFYATEGGISEVRARLKGVSTDENFAGDPVIPADPDPLWSAYIVTSDFIADGWTPASSDPGYNAAYKNFIPVPGTSSSSPPLDPDSTTVAANSIQTEMQYWVKIRHKREYDAQQMGHTKSKAHYDDDDGYDTADWTAASPGNIIYYGYKTLTATTQTEFTTTSTNPPNARPVNVVRAYGTFGGSFKVMEVDVKQDNGPNVDSALYGEIVGGNGTVEVHGDDNCGEGPDLDAVHYSDTGSSTWDPYPPGVGSITLGPAGKEIDQVPDKDIPAMVNSLWSQGDIDITSDQTNAVFGSADNYSVVRVDATAMAPDNEVDFNNLTGYGILLIRGDARFQGNLDWYGIILIDGDAYFGGGAGGKNIYGAVLIEGDVTMQGTVEIYYDSCEVRKAGSGNSVDILRWRDRDAAGTLN